MFPHRFRRVTRTAPSSPERIDRIGGMSGIGREKTKQRTPRRPVWQLGPDPRSYRDVELREHYVDFKVSIGSTAREASSRRSSALTVPPARRSKRGAGSSAGTGHERKPTRARSRSSHDQPNAEVIAPPSTYPLPSRRSRRFAPTIRAWRSSVIGTATSSVARSCPPAPTLSPGAERWTSSPVTRTSRSSSRPPRSRAGCSPASLPGSQAATVSPRSRSSDERGSQHEAATRPMTVRLGLHCGRHYQASTAVRNRCGDCGRQYDRQLSREKRARRARTSARWQQARALARQRDGNRCVYCHATTELQVHHKVRLEDGGPEFDPNNLETVCVDCHGKQHRAGRGNTGREPITPRASNPRRTPAESREPEPGDDVEFLIA